MVKRNEIIELEIEKLSFPNKGIGWFGEYKAVVKNTIPGQKVRARVSKKREGRLEASLVEVLEKAPYEISPGCSHFGLCGGCSYQNITVEKENEIKAGQVLELLAAAEIKNFKFEGIESAYDANGYRNKCEFSFGDEEKGGTLALGMRKKNSFYEVVTLRDCNIIDKDYIEIISRALEFFKKNSVPFYHKSKHDGVLRHLVVRKGAYTGEILINLVTSSGFNFSVKEFAEHILSAKLTGKISGILHTINDGVADIVKSDSTKIIYGQDYLTERLFSLTFKITAFSFFQTNTKGAEKLYSIVKEYVGDSRDKVIFDLYCGTGTISQIVAGNSRKVIGIEIVEDAVCAAKENALLNNINNCEFIQGDVLNKVDELSEKPDIIIVDPPRDGIHPKAIGKIINFGADKIIYVSCKPSSLARDLKIFQENGYNVERIKLCNQYGRTVHVESVALLSKII